MKKGSEIIVWAGVALLAVLAIYSLLISFLPEGKIVGLHWR